MIYLPLLVLSLTFATNTRANNHKVGDSDDLIHWEQQTCPSGVTDFYDATLRLTSDFSYKCLSSKITSSSLYTHQIRVSSNGLPDHSNNGNSNAQAFVYNIPISKPLPLGIDELLKQRPFKVDTLGDGVIGFAINGVPFFSSLADDNVDVVVGQNAIAADDCMGYLKNGIYHYKTAPPCLFAKSDNKGQGRDLVLGERVTVSE